MKWMHSSVEIGPNVFPHVNSIKFKQSRKDLIQRATILLPNIKSKVKLEDAVKVGQKVYISVGYDEFMFEEFSGYVSQIIPTRPFRIEVEDEMWQHKYDVINKSWKSVKLAEVLQFLVPNAEVNCQDITLTNFAITRVSTAKALEQIKDTYGLDVYYKRDKLYVGLAYLDGETRSVIYHLQKNCLEGKDLEFKRKEDVKIKIRAIGFTPENKKIEVVYPNDNLETYEERTLTFYDKTEAELMAIAKERINDFIYDGYRGTIKSFGRPLAQHGMVADIRDDKYPEREAKVFIDSVNTTYSAKGFRRDIELGRRAE